MGSRPREEKDAYTLWNFLLLLYIMSLEWVKLGISDPVYRSVMVITGLHTIDYPRPS